MKKDGTAAGRQSVNQTQTGYRRIHWTRRMLAAWLALSVVFALTPCCDVQAAVPPGTAHAAVFHDRADDGDPPCAAWLDRNDALLVEAGALLTPSPTLAIPVQLAFHLLPASFAAVRQPFVASAFPPDALYLRYLRLIL